VKTPFLSVIIPTWNRANLVCAAISSVLAQQGKKIEIIVVDDASSDNTLTIIRQRFANRVHLLQLPQHSGVSAARNAGIQVAQGEWLAFLDSDDLWLPDKLQSELDAIKCFPEAEVIISDSLRFNGREENGLEASSFSRFQQNGLLVQAQGRVCWMDQCSWLWTNSGNSVAICSITLQRRVLNKLTFPLFSQDLTCCEDWEMEVRLYQQCRVVVIPEVHAHIRCFEEDSRSGRSCPGRPSNPEQLKHKLLARLKVMQRSINPDQLSADLANEFKRRYTETQIQLNKYNSTT